jgi:hypothetical protein
MGPNVYIISEESEAQSRFTKYSVSAIYSEEEKLFKFREFFLSFL